MVVTFTVDKAQFSAPEDWIFPFPVRLVGCHFPTLAGTKKHSEQQKWRILGTFGCAIPLHLQAWLDSVGAPTGVQQCFMRHADIPTTMNVYGDAASADRIEAHGKIVGLALNGTEGKLKHCKMVGAIGFEPMTSTV